MALVRQVIHAHGTRTLSVTYDDVTLEIVSADSANETTRGTSQLVRHPSRARIEIDPRDKTETNLRSRGMVATRDREGTIIFPFSISMVG
jgi:hypothetical protein